MSLHVALRHRFDGLDLQVDFTARQGLTVLFGRSGCGKTSVVNAVAGLLRPDHGCIALDDVVLQDSERGVFVPAHRRRMGYVFQDARLFPHMDVRRNLRYGRWFAPKGGRDDFDRVVDMLGIEPLLSRRPAILSGGERQRVAIGRALLSCPRMLLMDEPLAALDAARKAEILPYLERLRDEAGLPILYVSHSLSEVMRLATDVVLMDDGQVRAAGPAAQVLSAPGMHGVPGIVPGVLIEARIIDHEADGLTRLGTDMGELLLAGVSGPRGRSLRLSLGVDDVMIASASPGRLGVLNAVPVTVQGVGPAQDGHVMVELAPAGGGQPLLARLHLRELAALSLQPGQQVQALIRAARVMAG